MIEIPIIIERLEELSRNMDDKVGWKEFKFCFKFFTSHIVSALKSAFKKLDFNNFNLTFRMESFQKFKSIKPH